MSKYVHGLRETTMLCLRCNRHYELFALPWPFRHYPEDIKRNIVREPSEEIPSKPISVREPPEEIALRRRIVREPSEDIAFKRKSAREPSEERPRKRSIVHVSSEELSRKRKTFRETSEELSRKRSTVPVPSEQLPPKRLKQEPLPKIKLTLRIPADYHEWRRSMKSSPLAKVHEVAEVNSVQPGKFPLVLIGRKLSPKSRCWPGLLLPSALVRLLSPESDPAADTVVYRLSDGHLKIITEKKIHRMNATADRFFNTLAAFPELLDRPGMRQALAYYESDILPSNLMSMLANSEGSHLNSPLFQASPARAEETSAKYCGLPGEAWLALFPREGFSELPVSILESKVFAVASNLGKHGLHYRVELTDTDTHRWIAPDQLIRKCTNSVIQP